MKTILAIDLGKRNSAFCKVNTSSLKPEYIVDNSCNWQYSSLAVRNGAVKENLVIDTGPVKLATDWNRHVNIIPTDTEQLVLQNCIKRGSPYGSDKWIKLAAAKLGLQMTLRPRGRPKKGS